MASLSIYRQVNFKWISSLHNVLTNTTNAIVNDAISTGIKAFDVCLDVLRNVIPRDE